MKKNPDELLRALTLEDSNKILPLLMNSSEISPHSFASRWTREHIHADLKSGGGVGKFFDTQLISYLLFRTSGENLEITHLATHEDFLRQKHMSTLMEYWLQNLPPSAQEIWLEVHASNTKALSFYQSFGFQQVGVRPNYYGNNEDACLFSLVLNGSDSVL